VDPRDHEFILGCSNESLPSLNVVVQKACAEGLSLSEITKINADWMAEANLMTYSDLVIQNLQKAGQKDKLAKWNARGKGLSIFQMRSLALSLGISPFWCWEKPRTAEGYYRIKGGLDYCIARGIAFSPYCDLLWMETKKPGIVLARRFARAVRKAYPKQMFAYNLSPSFNWDASGMTDPEIGDFQDKLGEEGFVWQFITLAGFHGNALQVTEFSRAFAKDKMLAYVTMIQRQERDREVETLTHQKWSGGEYMDATLKVVTGGLASTSAMGGENTESQFAHAKL
jgi:isocitrate lyase